jgi:hypothetical protein
VRDIIPLLILGTPPDGTSQFIKDGLAKGLPSEDTWTFEEQLGFPDGIANDKAAHVKTGHVVVKPAADRGLDLRLGQEVLQVGVGVGARAAVTT